VWYTHVRTNSTQEAEGERNQIEGEEMRQSYDGIKKWNEFLSIALVFHQSWTPDSSSKVASSSYSLFPSIILRWSFILISISLSFSCVCTQRHDTEQEILVCSIVFLANKNHSCLLQEKEEKNQAKQTKKTLSRTSLSRDWKRILPHSFIQYLSASRSLSTTSTVKDFSQEKRLTDLLPTMDD